MHKTVGFKAVNFLGSNPPAGNGGIFLTVCCLDSLLKNGQISPQYIAFIGEITPFTHHFLTNPSQTNIQVFRFASLHWDIPWGEIPH